VTFLDQVGALVPDRGSAVVVYCAGPRSRASLDAAEKLVSAGYADVRRFEGGREAWRGAGLPFDGRADEPREERPRDGDYAVDLERSLIGWVGRNPGGSHDGTLRFQSGRVTALEGRIAKARLEIDMTSIEVADLAGEMAELLRRHLESDDFFAVERHKVATLTIERMTPIALATPGAPNWQAQGSLTLRGVTQPVEFPAVVAMRNGGDLTIEAHFDLDRTRWGVHYGSGRLYAQLGMHLVNDHVSVQVRVVAR
jgi:polyisoprenoid-binding protein YceI